MIIVPTEGSGINFPPVDMQSALPSPITNGSLVSNPTGQRDAVPLKSQEFALDSLAAERTNLKSEGFPEAVITTAFAATRASSRVVYDTRWAVWSSWCGEGNTNPFYAFLTLVLEFYLQTMADKHLAVNTIKGCVTAMSNRHSLVEGVRLGSHPTVVRRRKGLENRRGLQRTLIPSRNLE